MFERFTPFGRRVIARAGEEAGQLQAARVDTRHLLIALVAEERSLMGEPSIAARVLSEAGLTYHGLRELELPDTEGSPRSLPMSVFTDEIKKSLWDSFINDMDAKRETIAPEHILVALLQQRSCLALDALRAYDLDPGALRATTLALIDQADAASAA
jgi:ATP-dependent Clp protease ATP-binding subunit ClpC